MNFDYDLIVIGGGHAGVEASAAGAHLGFRTLLLTLNKKMIANMPCNPHIGGSAKGVVVREIDALGGMMGIAADVHPLQMKMLNTGKGPGVQCLRSQQDKFGYPAIMQKMLEEIPNLFIEEGEAVDIVHDDSSVGGVILKDGKRITSRTVIITTGTYLASTIIRGKDVNEGGPDGEKSAIGLSQALKNMGIELIRLKTGTPPRVSTKTIDFSNALIQLGSDEKLAFSYQTKKFTPLKDQLPCYLIYTSDETMKLIKDNLSESALFNGTITSNGPRYCPSIESKIVRFADKQRHQLFLEPEFEDGDSTYIQGFSTGMPIELQEKMVHSLPGLENCKILKYAYQIEYDSIMPLQLDPSLRVKKYKGLYAAGQICGTSGYEEAGGLGLVAGINACRYMKGEEPLILKRNESYIGVMIDDIVTKESDEPYRLMSSRAEYRLLLRHDNADLRLSRIGYEIGLLPKWRYDDFVAKYQKIDEVIDYLSSTIIDNKEELNKRIVELGGEASNYGYKGLEILKRPHWEYKDLLPLMKDLESFGLDDESILALQTKVKYEGYIKKEEKEAANLIKEEEMRLPENIDYSLLDGLRLEARQKLNLVKPRTIAQASRISGVNPADISILLLLLRKEKLL